MMLSDKRSMGRWPNTCRTSWTRGHQQLQGRDRCLCSVSQRGRAGAQGDAGRSGFALPLEGKMNADLTAAYSYIKQARAQERSWRCTGAR